MKDLFDSKIIKKTSLTLSVINLNNCKVCLLIFMNHLILRTRTTKNIITLKAFYYLIKKNVQITIIYFALNLKLILIKTSPFTYHILLFFFSWHDINNLTIDRSKLNSNNLTLNSEFYYGFAYPLFSFLFLPQTNPWIYNFFLIRHLFRHIFFCL